MTTVVNTPSSGDDSANVMGNWVGMVLAIILLLAIVFWLFPLFRSGMRGGDNTTPTTQTAPPAQPESGSTNIDIPKKIDVNVNQPNGGSSQPQTGQ